MYTHSKGHSIRSLRLAFGLLLLGLLCFSWPVKSPLAQQDNEPVEYIFKVMMPPNWRIAEAIFAYEHNGHYYLPIIELSKGFEFFVEAEPDRQFVQGFASVEENSFTIDGDRHEITIKGNRESIDEDAILNSDLLATDDIYVEMELLNKIWPVQMHIDLSDIAIVVEAEEELSFIRRREREKNRTIVESRKEIVEKEKVELPFRKNPYEILGKPVIDYQAVYRHDRRSGEYSGDNIFSGRQQVLGMIADYSTNFTLDDGRFRRPDNARLKFERRSPGKEYIVPGIRGFEGGDISIRQRDLISNTEGGRGILITNDSRDPSNEFDRITIQGSGPPGWEMELYNNDEIMEFSVVPDDGEYTFNDIILGHGNNQIKILFFGPQGQVREETRSYNAGGNMRSPGEFTYSAGLLDSEREFIPLDDEPRTTPRGVVRTGSVAYGISRWLTAFAGFTTIPLQDKRHDYMTAGVAASTPIGLAEAEVYKDKVSGNAIDLKLITSLFGIRLNTRTGIYNGLESTDSGFGDNAKSFESEIQANKNTRFFSIPLGLRFNVLHTERENHDRSTTIDFARSFSRKGLRVTHSDKIRLDDGRHEQTTGSIVTTWREGPWQLRGGFNYELFPEKELSSTNAQVRYSTKNDVIMALNLNHNFTNSIYGIGAQIGYDFKKFLGTFDADYERERGWEFIVRATTSLHSLTPDRSFAFDSKSRRNYAPIFGMAYLDKDEDGEFDEGSDQPLEGVKLLVGGSTAHKEGSDESGNLVANGPHNERVNVEIDPKSLSDPYYVPGPGGFSTVPLYGGVIEAAFPVVETGAIEGTVFRASNGRAVTGMDLELVNEKGETVMTVESAFDGYYTFEFVPSGTYTIRPAASHNVTLADNHVTLTPEELFAYGNDLYLEDGKGQSASQDVYGPELPDDEFISTDEDVVEDAYGPVIPEVESDKEESNISEVEEDDAGASVYGPVPSEAATGEDEPVSPEEDIGEEVEDIYGPVMPPSAGFVESEEGAVDNE